MKDVSIGGSGEKEIRVSVPNGLTAEQTEYVGKAMIAGTMKVADIVIIVVISKLLEKPILEVQSAYMDASTGIQQVFRQL